MAEMLDRRAKLSFDGRYRWTLYRRWADGPPLTWIMLNPSTADAEQDDPTIRRCIGFSRSWGYGRMAVVNLYGYRATDPRELWSVDDPVGEDNDEWITAMAMGAVANGGIVVAAWGAHARRQRVAEVLGLPGMEQLHVLDLTKQSQPKHPLYLPGRLKPQPWTAPALKGAA